MKLLIPALMLLAALPVCAQDDIEAPAELAPLFTGRVIVAVEKGDLNRDGSEDVIVVSQPVAKEGADPYEDVPRRLSLFVREEGRLRLAKENEKVVYCATCGGVFGDPFNGIIIKPGRFTVSHYGGSAWRWTADYSFAWSRRDRTWQLVKIERSSFHATTPDEQESQVEKPPKDFGKIDLADFDPENYRTKTK